MGGKNQQLGKLAGKSWYLEGNLGIGKEIRLAMWYWGHNGKFVENLTFFPTNKYFFQPWELPHTYFGTAAIVIIFFLFILFISKVSFIILLDFKYTYSR